MLLMIIVGTLTILAFDDSRAPDFFTITKTPDLATLGTCVERLTKPQLEFHKYHEGGDQGDCGDDDKETVGNRRRQLKGSLEVSLHGLVYATNQPENADNVALRVATDAVITATLGGPEDRHADMAYPHPAGLVVPPVNFSVAYEALSVVAETAVPKTCDEIYGLNEASLDGVATEFIANIRKGKYDDDDYDATMRYRTMQNDKDRNERDTWPLGDVLAVCDGNEHLTAVDPAETLGLTKAMADAPLKLHLYAHCVAQFLYLSVGTEHSRGTFGIPMPGRLPGPAVRLFARPDGFDKDSSYSTKGRLYVGWRFGYSAWGYSVLLLASCYLFADALVLLLAELGMPSVNANLSKNNASAISQLRDKLIIKATRASLRKYRLGLSLVVWLLSVVFAIVFLWVPFGVFHSLMPRPECETGDAEHDVGTQLFGWVGPDILLATQGGWKVDHDASIYALYAVLAQIVVIFLIPFTTIWVEPLLKAGTDAVGGEENQRLTQAAAKTEGDSRVPVDTKSVQLLKYPFRWLILFALILIVGQLVVCQIMGDAWSDAVVGHKRVTVTPAVVASDGTITTPAVMRNEFDERVLGSYVYDQASATLLCISMCALVAAGISQRYLFYAVSIVGSFLYLAYALLIVLFTIPIVVVAGIRSFSDEGDASTDCRVLSGNSHDACISRFFTFIIGAGGVLLIAAFVVVTGLIQVIPRFLTVSTSESVAPANSNDGWNAAFSPVVAATGPIGGAGTRASADGFFNFQSKLKTADSFYARR